MKFFIQTLGCKVNQYDSFVLSRKLKEIGFVFSKIDPDLVIVNTCAVTQMAIKKDKRALKGLQKKFPKAKFAVIGCWPETYGKKIEMKNVEIIGGVGNHDLLLEKICDVFDLSRSKKKKITIDAPKSGGRSRYFLKIQDGCEQFCSYCIIPFARGKMQSRKKEDVIEEVKEAISIGFGEIVLCGIHLGLYGKEKNSKTCDLVVLLKNIVELDGLGRVRLSSLEVNDVSDELLRLMSENDKICRHLHISLQSGSDKILKTMKRPYSTAFFEDVIGKARSLMKDIAITTDVIVGFPGETDDDFIETIKFVEKSRFSRIHVFPFSSHENTPASSLNDQVEKQTKKERSGELQALGIKLQNQYGQEFQGKKLNIAIEAVQGGEVKGKSEYYFNVKFPVEKIKITDSRESLVGSIVQVDGEVIEVV